MKRRVSKYAFPIFIIIILLALSFQTMISIDDEMIIDECMLFEESNCEHQKFLVITLDDRKHLQSWWNNRDLFLEHDLTLTMFIDRTSGLNETEWGWLKQFQTDGHEIGVHGSNHSSVTDFLEEGGNSSSYFEIEIYPEIERFNAQGIYPTAFAYPHGHRTSEIDEELLKYFRVVRATDRWSGNDDLGINQRFDEKVVKGYSTDREYNSTAQLISELDRIDVIVTYGHRLDSRDNPYHTTEPSDIIELVTAARSKGYSMKTISELAQPNHNLGLEIMYKFLDTGSIDIADRMLENCWAIQRFEETCFDGEFPDWDENPYDENYWIFIYYSLRPLRHLLYAWQTTGDVEYRDYLIDVIESFAEAADESEYIYETVADKHGAAFRLMVLINVKWKLAHELSISNDEIGMIDDLIEQTTSYLVEESNFQKNSNHGYTQAAALWIAVTNEKNLNDRHGRFLLTIERLQYMMETIIGSDGVMIENTPYYHLYILNKVGDIYNWGKENSVLIPSIMEQRLPLMVDYALRSVYPDGKIPLLGAAIPGTNLKSQKWGDFENDYPELEWAISEGKRGTQPSLLESYFPSAGQTTWRSSWNSSSANTSHLLFDVGDYRTDHSDLDALTLTWWAGREIIIDSGLYSYEDSSIRDYFHGTSAHNTLVVDNLDQIEGGTFGTISETIGSNLPYHLSFSAHSLNDVWIGRTVLAIGNHTLVVIDHAEDNSVHDFELNWHLSHDLSLIGSEEGLDIMEGDERIGYAEIVSNQILNQNIWNGSDEPFRGWTIDGYEILRPTTNWEIESDDTNEFQTITVFSLSDERPIIDLVDSDSDQIQLSVEFTDEMWILTTKGTTDYDGSNPTDVELNVERTRTDNQA
ncbi:heparinase II/III family protein [Candidatus Poseidoniaceae archaeon]|nr:heparinase II/III family protein [Candidatus Poseidoniaceae archaeon]